MGEIYEFTVPLFSNNFRTHQSLLNEVKKTNCGKYHYNIFGTGKQKCMTNARIYKKPFITIIFPTQ
jgi:hypothetical protein